MTAGDLEPAEAQRLLRSAERFADFGRGLPLLIVGATKPDVVWASPSASALFATTSRDRMTRALFGPSTNRTMIERLRRLRPGAPDHLERLALNSGFHVERLTLLSRAVDDERLGKVIVVQIAGGPAHLPDEPESERPFPPTAAETPPVLQDPAPHIVVTAAEPEASPEEPPPNLWRVLEEVSADFVARQSAGRQPRFVWELDPDGRLVAVGGGLADYVGSTAPRPGQRLDELLDDYAPEAAALLRTAWSERRSFSGLIVPWPVERSDARVAVALGGAPLRGKAAGFRGFGVVHLDQVSSAPQAEPLLEEPVPVQSPSLQSVSPVEETAPEPEEDTLYLHLPDAEMEEIGLRGDEATSSELTRPASATPPEPPQESSKIVHLSRFKGANQNSPGSPVPNRPVAPPPAAVDQAAVLPPEPQWSESPGVAAAPAVQLSSTEQSAFKEIARTLGGFEAAEADAPEADEHARAPMPAPSADQPSGTADLDGIALLERLPLGVLVIEGERIVFANSVLLGLLGFSDLVGLAGSVGAAPLVGTAGRAGDLTAGPRRVGLRDQNGSDLVVEAWTQAVPWRGAPAVVTFVRPLDHEEDAARMEAIRLDLARAQTLAQDLAEALEAAASGVGFLDASGRILSINAAAEQFFGYDQREVVGDTAALFVAPDEAQAWSAFLARVTSVEAPGRAERRPFTGRKRSGEPVGLEVALKRLEGGRLSVVWQARHGEIDHDLDVARREAERASKRKSEFLAKVSHEIRTPLNAIIGFAEIMMEERFGPVGNDRYKEYLGDIHASGAHVLSLVNDLLDLSRIEAGRSDLKLVAVNANAIVGDCVGTLQSQAHRERVILRLSLAPRLPPILADERALRQIVLNLLSNAVKFNEPGGQVIVSTALTENESIAIRVRDTGLGMSEKDIETAMEPFRQLETPKASAGSGLGLPLTKALVEASRASMVIKSRPHEGTLVEVTFQQSPAEAVSVPAE